MLHLQNRDLNSYYNWVKLKKKKKKKKKKILNNLSPRGFDWLKMQTIKRLQPDRVSMTAFSER